MLKKLNRSKHDYWYLNLPKLHQFLIPFEVFDFRLIFKKLFPPSIVARKFRISSFFHIIFNILFKLM